MTDLVISTPDVANDRAVAAAVVSEASGIVVTDQASFDAAGTFVRRCASTSRGIETKLAPAIDAAHKAHKAMTSLRADLTAPFAAARRIVEPRMIAWQDAERRRREAESAIIAEQARRAAEAEQLAAAAEVAEFDTDAADAILDAPIVAPVVVAEAPKTEGVSIRETWKAEVVDFAALVASGRVEFLTPNQTALDAMARALRGVGSPPPGVRFVAVRTASVRS